MAKFLSPRAWKALLATKDCKSLKEPELEKLILQFESAEKSQDAKAADAPLKKITLKFRDLKKANPKNRELIKWMDQASEEAEQLVAAWTAEPAAAPSKEQPAPAKQEAKPKAEAPAEPKAKAEKPAAPEPAPAKEKPEAAKEKPPAKKVADAKDAPPSKEDAQRAKLGETLATELTLAKRRSKDKASKFVLNVDARAPGLMMTRKEMTPNLLKAAVFLTGKKGKVLQGLCFGAGGKHVFVFPGEPSDVLIRLLKKAALLHAGMKIKLKVMGGGVELDDGEEPDPEELEDAAETPVEEPPSATDDAPEAPALDPKALKDRFIAAAGGLKQKLTGDAEASAALNKDMTAVAAALKGRDFALADELIAKLEARLAEPVSEQADAVGETEEAPDAADAMRAANFDLAKARLQWEQARSAARTQAENAIAQFNKQFPHAPLLVTIVRDVLDDLDEALRDALDDTISAKTPEERERCVARSLTAAETVLGDIDSNETIVLLEQLPQDEKPLREPLMQSLAEVKRRLAA